MRITILGATGGTGLRLLRQGLERGHEVTAVVRDAARLPDGLRDRLDVHQGDVTHPGSLAPAVEGRDAVLSALGPRGRGPTTICQDGIAAVLEAIAGTGTRRVLMVSASGLAADAGDGPFTRYVLKPLIVQRVFRDVYADLAKAEDVLRGSDTDWTIVRPSRLTDGGPTGRYRTALDLNVRGGHTTTRADLADCMLALIGDASSVRRVVSVAS
ncbi:NAD(P)-dependent oxidoreductase [Nonomuraea aridisoli]|uniref:NADH-flavin reductase n=1 Tax=Nonomuraea aridisoli TaxID=2070368 RepID=A0A2W2FSS2_9ACTN|nr:SDR family oxidoreductase [Nonomuraea aridisoli]PZG18084.1 NADH-flavin reductase [Nonomuraea aridisoli]